jgi:hypothetical protein
MGNDIADLKREVFFRLMELAGRVFVVVRHSDSVSIGRRGFTEEERKNGLVLVFNRGMNFTWDSTGIHATLLFSSTPEKCYIPPEDIVAVYSPELRVQFSAEPVKAGEIHSEAPLEEASAREEGESGDSDNIIKVDFTKKWGGGPGPGGREGA